MNSSSYMGISTMKPCCRILITCKNSSFPGSPSAKSLVDTFSGRALRLAQDRRSDGGHLRILGLSRSPIHPSRSNFGSPGSNWGRSRVSIGYSCLGGGRGILVISNVASDIRHASTSVESQSGGKSFEQIYVQGMSVKPLVIERIESENPRLGDSVDVNIDNLVESEEAIAVSSPAREVSESEEEAWTLLRDAVVNYCSSPVGTVAANDPADKLPLNYDQVFIRDFVPSALAFLLKGESEIVRNFLLHTLQLQSWEKTVDCYSPGQGLMPASFKVRTVPLDGSNEAFEEVLDPDFGESAIGRVAPVDSGLWWIILLRAYGKITGDYALQERVDVQTGIKLILNLCLSDGFDMFPSLLVTDGSCMIDRRMGIHGHPLEIQEDSGGDMVALPAEAGVLIPTLPLQTRIRQYSGKLKCRIIKIPFFSCSL